MRSVCTLLLFFIIAETSLSIARVPGRPFPEPRLMDSDLNPLGVPSSPDFTAPSTSSQKRHEAETLPQDQEPLVIERCRAEELSPGGALAILTVLATGSSIHMPGSLIIPRRSRFYRLAPELGIADSLVTVLLILKALSTYRKTLRQSVTAVLLLRYYRSEDDLWWQNSPPPSPPAEGDPSEASLLAWRACCYENTKLVLARIRRFGYERLISDALMILASIKAFAVRGTVRTTLLACSYALSFFTIELLSLAAVHIGPTPSRSELEVEAAQVTELMTLLDNSDSAWRYRARPQWQQDATPETWPVRIRSALAYVVYGLPGALHLIFLPFSIPLFVLYETTTTHTANGKWRLSYLTSAVWFLYTLVAVCGISAAVYFPALVMGMMGLRKKRKAYIGMWETVLTMFQESAKVSGWIDTYTVLKVALIIRFYASGYFYTGTGTRKPEWLEWLG